MILFYTDDVDGNIARLDVEQARHCVQVLRKKEGDAISFVDGTGNFYEGIIQETGKKKCVIQILKTHHSFNKRPFKLHIAIAPTKNINRLEWFLEKATEIGIDSITPIICDHSERKVIKPERFERILQSAMKQSLNCYLPKLNDAISFKDFINLDFEGDLFIAHCEETDRKSLKQQLNPKTDITILIGPEGDFSVKEITEALKNNFIPVTLGETRLRTETAAIVACHSVAFLNEAHNGQ